MVGGLLEGPPSLGLVAPGALCGPVQLPLQALDGFGHLVLPITEAGQLVGTLLAAGGELADVVLHLPLLADQLVHLTQGLIGVAAGPVRPGVFQAAAGVLQPVQGRFGGRCVATTAGGAPHGVGGLLELPGRLLHLGVARLSGQALELSGGLFGLLGQLPLGG